MRRSGIRGRARHCTRSTSPRCAARSAPALRPDNPGAFNPRAVIGEVVRNVLVEHAEAIADGTFPDAKFRRSTPPRPLSAACRGRRNISLEDLDPLGADRHATFLEFWGDAPAAPVNLSPVMHHAFDISLLDLEELSRPPGQERKPASGSQKPQQTDGLPASVQRMIDHVEDWATRGRVLNQGTASELRGIIRDAVVQRCLWNNPLMPEPTGEVLRSAMPAGSAVVSIEGAAAENRPGTADAPIKFSRVRRQLRLLPGPAPGAGRPGPGCRGIGPATGRVCRPPPGDPPAGVRRAQRPPTRNCSPACRPR